MHLLFLFNLACVLMSFVDQSYTYKFTARIRMRYYKRTQEVSIQRSLSCSRNVSIYTVTYDSRTLSLYLYDNNTSRCKMLLLQRATPAARSAAIVYLSLFSQLRTTKEDIRLQRYRGTRNRSYAWSLERKHMKGNLMLKFSNEFFVCSSQIYIA